MSSFKEVSIVQLPFCILNLNETIYQVIIPHIGVRSIGFALFSERFHWFQCDAFKLLAIFNMQGVVCD